MRPGWRRPLVERPEARSPCYKSERRDPRAPEAPPAPCRRGPGRIGGDPVGDSPPVRRRRRRTCGTRMGRRDDGATGAAGPRSGGCRRHGPDERPDGGRVGPVRPDERAERAPWRAEWRARRPSHGQVSDRVGRATGPVANRVGRAGCRCRCASIGEVAAAAARMMPVSKAGLMRVHHVVLLVIRMAGSPAPRVLPPVERPPERRGGAPDGSDGRRQAPGAEGGAPPRSGRARPVRVVRRRSGGPMGAC